jgi:hypothetical protein
MVLAPFSVAVISEDKVAKVYGEVSRANSASLDVK